MGVRLVEREQHEEQDSQHPRRGDLAGRTGRSSPRQRRKRLRQEHRTSSGDTCQGQRIASYALSESECNTGTLRPSWT